MTLLLRLFSFAVLAALAVGCDQASTEPAPRSLSAKPPPPGIGQPSEAHAEVPADSVQHGASPAAVRAPRPPATTEPTQRMEYDDAGRITTKSDPLATDPHFGCFEYRRWSGGG
jgi:hypothetical protein